MPTVLTGQRNYLSLNAQVDVERLTRAARTLIQGPPQDEDAAGDFRLVAQADDLLPGWYDDWVLIERERLYQLRLHALEAHVARLLASHRYADALDAAFRALAVEPYRASLHQLIARIHLAEGNINDAIRTFQLYQRVVTEERERGPHARPAPLVTLTDIERWLDPQDPLTQRLRWAGRGCPS